MKNVVMKNVSAGWLDKDTFKLVFDGGIDADGDMFFYCCEYWKDVDEWHFQKIYEDDYVDADFTKEQSNIIKEFMRNQMNKTSI